MRVIVLQRMAGVAGSEGYYLQLLPELVRRGVQAEFLLIQRPHEAEKNAVFVETLTEQNVPVTVLNFRGRFDVSLLPRLARQLASYDVVHANLFHAELWCILVRLLFLPRMKLILMKHGYDDAFQARHGFDPSKVRVDRKSLLTRISARLANHVVTISDGLRKLLVDSGMVPASKTSVIPYGFSFESACSKAAPGECRLSDYQLLMVARLVPVKQHHLAFRVMPRLLRRFPSLKLVLVGAGSFEQELRARAKKLGIEDAVVFAGFRRNVHDYLRDSDLLLLLSSSEGFGAVILESWYNRKPVVAFDVPAPNEIITHGVNGVLLPPFDTEALERAISELLGKDAARQAMGENGYRTYQENYTLEMMIEKTIAVYDRILRDRAN